MYAIVKYMIKVVVLFFAAMIVVGCFDRLGRKSVRVVEITLRGSYDDTFEKVQRKRVSVSELRQAVQRWNDDGSLDTLVLKVSPGLSWTTTNKVSFASVFTALSCLTNVPHVVLHVGPAKCELDFSPLSNVSLDEIGFVNYGRISPVAFGLDELVVDRIVLDDVCSVEGIGPCRSLKTCRCRMGVPTMSVLKEHFGTSVEIHDEFERTDDLLDRLQRRGITAIEYEDDGFYSDQFARAFSLDLSSRRFILPAYRGQRFAENVFDISSNNWNVVVAMLNGVDFDSWRDWYENPTQCADQFRGWQLRLMSGTNVVREVAGLGDAPADIRRFWRLDFWGFNQIARGESVGDDLLTIGLMEEGLGPHYEKWRWEYDTSLHGDRFCSHEQWNLDE